MKTSLLITFFLFPFVLSAQKLLKPNVDKITNDTTWSSSQQKLFWHGNFLTIQGEAVVFQLKKFGRSGPIVLVLNPQNLNTGDSLAIAKGQKAYLKLTDNAVITLSSATDDSGNTHYGTVEHLATMNSSASGYYVLSDTDIEKLKSQTLVFLRIETSAGNFDCDIKPKNAVLLKKAIVLIENIK